MSRSKDLTERQQQVCERITTGFSAKETAMALGIGTRTVESHLAVIYEKLGVRNAVELTRKFLGAS